MAENPKPRVHIVNDDSVPATFVVVIAEKSESVDLAKSVLQDFDLQIKGELRSGGRSVLMCLDSGGHKLTDQFVEYAFVAVGFIVDGFSYDRRYIVELLKSMREEDNVHKETIEMPNAWPCTGNHTSGALKRDCCVSIPSVAKELEGLMPQFGSSSRLLTRKGILPIDPVIHDRDRILFEGLKSEPHDKEINIRILEKAMKDEGKGINIREDIPLGDENVASTITPSNINNSPHQSSVPDNYNERVGAAGCCRWTAGWKNILSYADVNALVKGDQSKSNGACSDLEAGVTKETATTSRGINYSETALSTFAYTLIGLNFSVPFAIMAIRDGRMSKLAEKLILIIALVTLFLETGIIGLISLRGISSYRTAKVIFTIILSLFLGMAVLVSLSALCLF